MRFSKDGTQLQLTAVDGRRALVVLPNDPELVDILARNGVDISGGCGCGCGWMTHIVWWLDVCVEAGLVRLALCAAHAVSCDMCVPAFCVLVAGVCLLIKSRHPALHLPAWPPGSIAMASAQCQSNAAHMLCPVLPSSLPPLHPQCPRATSRATTCLCSATYCSPSSHLPASSCSSAVRATDR